MGYFLKQSNKPGKLESNNENHDAAGTSKNKMMHGPTALNFEIALHP